MFAFSALIYIAALLSFSMLYTNEAAKSTVETVILAYDNTGNDGYTCQMISRVTSDYQIATTSDPSFAYNVVNVMESSLECQDNIQATEPCEYPLTYFPGTAVALNMEGRVYGAAALAADDSAYYFEVWTNYPANVDKYLYTTGQLGDSPIIESTSTNVIQTNSLAVDRNSYAIYVASEGAVNATIFRAPPEDERDTLDLIQFNTGAAQATVFHDNEYNIYYAAGVSFCSLDVYVSPAVSTVLFNLTAGDSFLYVAVYFDGLIPTVYYRTAQTTTIYVFRDGTHTVLPHSEISTLSGLVVDGSNRLYFGIARADDTQMCRYYYDAERFFECPGVLETVVPFSGLAITPAGDRIFATYQDSSGRPVQAFVFPLAQNADPYSEESDVVMQISHFGAMWFTCGDKVSIHCVYSYLYFLSAYAPQ